MRRDFILIMLVLLATLIGLMLSSKYYVSNTRNLEKYSPPEYYYMAVIIPSYIILIAAIIIGYHVYKTMKLIESQAVKELYNFMVLWGLIAFETIVGWTYFHMTHDSLCYVEVLSLRIYVWFITHAWFFPILGGVAYYLLQVGLEMGKKQRKKLSHIELILLLVVSVLIFLPWNYWAFNPPETGVFTRPLVYGLSMLAGLIACIPSIACIRDRLLRIDDKVLRARLKMIIAGFVGIVIFWVFLFAHSVLLAVQQYGMAHILLGISGLSALLSPIFIYLGVLAPSWFISLIE